MTREEAIKWLQAEKLSLERAPDLNGCPMTEDWKKGIDVYDMAISALRSQQSKGVEIDQVKNAPLTLDELREMDGEPAYIVYPGFEKDCPGHWEILERAGKWGWNGNHGEYFESNYESMWLAYRRKPEEGTV